MRRSLSVLTVVALALSTMSLAPAQAAAPKALVAAQGVTVEKVGGNDRRWKKHRRHADRHWKRDRRHSHRRHYSHFYVPFPFIAPYAFAPRYSYAPQFRCHGRIVYRHGRAHCLPYY